MHQKVLEIYIRPSCYKNDMVANVGDIHWLTLFLKMILANLGNIPLKNLGDKG